MSADHMLKRVLGLLAGVALALAVTTLVRAAERPDGPWEVAKHKGHPVLAMQDDLTPDLMAYPEILGTAVALGDDGEPELVIYADQETPGVGDLVKAIPPRLRGIAVSVQLTDKFRALKGGKGGGKGGGGGGGGGGISHTAKQTPPIQLGTSGGWGYDLANGYCCGGTLGSLVQIGGAQYILSNYHVLRADIVAGGNSRVAQTGDTIIQPGLIDVGCYLAGAQGVATLAGVASLPGSNVDAAIAAVVPGMVRTDGAILEIGTLSATTANASLNQAVKKSGRTTGLTRSKVSGLNATISVVYDNECAGGTAFTKIYTGQIVIANKNSSFIAGGDSGSLMVEDVATNPRAVGLLYAGSNSTAIANPIGEVLSFLGATMVGK